MENATYVPINNSCERGLRAELRAYLLGREINGGRRPVAPDARVKLTSEQASWLNVVCDHEWPEYQAVAWATARPTTDTLYPFKARPTFAHVETCAYDHTYPARELQELLNRLDEFRASRGAAEFDAECARSGIRTPGALNTPLGRAIVRGIRGAAGKDTTTSCDGCDGAPCGIPDACERADAHRYGALAEDIVPVTAVCVCGATNADDCRNASEHPCARV